ncbi:hypothetical protein OBBRIDRAFT_48478 [Obba rivulosa]|uniref:Uncharacterized protein n=1 Tax=Obba rivulosa TaxID=1052685 RepID=A0A8E2DRZ8_9APHY|nr:hypothetical protein OBBRIDRAFT_48478 [Obba rivulosa]
MSGLCLLLLHALSWHDGSLPRRLFPRMRLYSIVPFNTMTALVAFASALRSRLEALVLHISTLTVPPSNHDPGSCPHTDALYSIPRQWWPLNAALVSYLRHEEHREIRYWLVVATLSGHLVPCLRYERHREISSPSSLRETVDICQAC